MNDPLIKIPCLLLVTTGFHRTLTPPNPPQPGEKGMVTVPSISDRWLRFMFWVESLKYLKTCLWFSSLAESAVIIANAYPSHPLSNFVSSRLLFGRDGTQIQLTVVAAAAVLLGLAGAALRVRCYNELGKDFTFEMSIKENHRLVTTGPYSVVRHPSYAGVLMTASAVALLHGTRGSWLRESGFLSLLPVQIVVGIFAIMLYSSTFSLMLRMADEDEGLRRQFGNDWYIWAERVRYLVIPGLV